jgi:hypothetical protein
MYKLKVGVLFFALILTSAYLRAQNANDTITLFDYWENPFSLVKGFRGFSVDYLQIIINEKNTIILDARAERKKIKFNHPIKYSQYEQRRCSGRIFNHFKFAGLQITKPAGQPITLQVRTIHNHNQKSKYYHNFDTTLLLDKINNNKLVLWNLYDFYAGLGGFPYYFYPRYTLHNYNWPTPEQWAKYRKRNKVLRQIEKAIVYRYNTTTRQITKS